MREKIQDNLHPNYLFVDAHCTVYILLYKTELKMSGTEYSLLHVQSTIHLTSTLNVDSRE